MSSDAENFKKFFKSSRYIIDIDKLVLSHKPSMSSCLEARRRMLLASKKKLSRRSPIKIKYLSSGKYLVIDGNTTVSVLKDMGYTSVPVELIKK